jgi:predicted DNA-binding transcriptional regulator AlpA
MSTQNEQPNTDELTLMDIGETCRFFGGSNSPLNPATLYRGIKAGKYPPPVKIGQGTSRWVRGECENALRKMIAARAGMAAA